MRSVLLVGVIGLVALVAALGLIFAPNSSLEAFDAHDPATFLPIIADGLQGLHSLVRARVETATAELRDDPAHGPRSAAPAVAVAPWPPSPEGERPMPMPVSHTERQRTVPRLRYCPHCGFYVSTHWRHDYCQRCGARSRRGRIRRARTIRASRS
jgi:hypothetical protein